MASPATISAARPTTPQTHPLTPPAEPPTTTANNSFNSNPTNSNANSSSQPAPPSSANPVQSSATNSNALAPPSTAPPSQPITSATDTGLTRRPRDARLIHLLLSSMGITAYQERVPLQLLDFAYRYTSGILSDAMHLQAEGYENAVPQTTGKGKKDKAAAAAAAAAGAAAGPGGDGSEEGGLSVEAIRTAVSSRMAAQGGMESGGGLGAGGVPRQWLMERAEERNRVALPVPGGGGVMGTAKAGAKDEGLRMAGMRLPSERYCLSGVGWGMREEWESEGEEEIDEGGGMDVDGSGAGGKGLALEDDEENVDMEDVFGDAVGDGDGDSGGGAGGGGGGGDQVMGNA
ncbi:MAG: hypothetical protein Q9160_008543 [Pyrenula sp. 1 TL-2023]